MSPEPYQRANGVPWPPLLYVATAAGAWALERLTPLDWFGRTWPLTMIGGVVAVAGFALGSAAITQFRRARTPVSPTGRAAILVSSGVYARTRNPMYLGVSLAYFGVGLALGSEWLVVLACVMPVLLQKLAVEREERHLEARFREEWRAYAAGVRRGL